MCATVCLALAYIIVVDRSFVLFLLFSQHSHYHFVSSTSSVERYIFVYKHVRRVHICFSVQVYWLKNMSASANPMSCTCHPMFMLCAYVFCFANCFCCCCCYSRSEYTALSFSLFFASNFVLCFVFCRAFESIELRVHNGSR